MTWLSLLQVLLSLLRVESTAYLLQPHPFHTTLPRRSIPTFCRGGDNALAAASKNSTNNNSNKGGFLLQSLEGMVRQVTGETEYQMGDLGDEGEEEEYQYQFGDITRSILAELKNEPDNKRQLALQQLRKSLGDKDVPIDVLEKLYSQLDQKQRINLILAGIQLGSEGVVLWGLATNVCTLLTASIAWTASLMSSTVSCIPLLPLGVDKELWRTFTSKFLALDLALSPFFLIAKAVATLVGFRRYHSLVAGLSTSKWISQQKKWQQYNSKVLNKCVAVVTAFFLTNIVLSALAAAATFTSIGFLVRLWSTVNIV